MNAPAASCGGITQTLWQATVGAWDKVYSGSFGEVRVGIQYSLSARDYFSTQTTVTTAAAAAVGMTAAQASAVYSPKTYENTIMTSIRYYPFAAPPVAPPLVTKY
jgi:tagatose-1,6-bisphosphate aldolase non-catalytic subunit AgaZ/GatZ